MSPFYTISELKAIGFKKHGSNALISRKASIYSPDKISIGNNTRIDDFCILSGEIHIGSYVHISAYTALYGKYGIFIEDFAGLSPRCTVFSATDDFSGEYMVGPMIDSKYTNVFGSSVTMKKYSQVGCNCVIFPDVTIGEGTAVGAMSLIIENLKPWSIYRGIPATFLKKRSANLLKIGFEEK